MTADHNAPIEKTSPTETLQPSDFFSRIFLSLKTLLNKSRKDAVVIAKSQSYQWFSVVSFLLMSGLSSFPALAVEPTEEKPACPGRPPYVQPTDSDVAETGLSWEVLCVITNTPLFRDLPGPDESPDLLRRYLRQEPYENLGDTEYRALMEEAVELWPLSRYAHAGLAYALLAGHGVPQSLSDRQRAADELLTAAEIAFSQGKVRYETEIAQLLGDLGDRDRLVRYFSRAFELLPEGTRRYPGYLHYARALAKLDDDQAETFFQKAIELSPPGIGEAYEFYAGNTKSFQK